jgi:Tfp pilus assembly protein PilF
MMARVVCAIAGALTLAAASLIQPGPPSAHPRDRIERAYSATNRGVAYLEQYDYTSAAGAFRDALRIAPNLAAAHLDLAIALLYAGDTALALPEARAAAAGLPNAPQPVYILALIARADNRSADAEAAFRKVLSLDPTDPGSNVNLGQLLLEDKQYPQAAAAFREALTIEPYNATASYGLATAFSRTADPGAPQQMAAFERLRSSPYAITYTQGYLQQGRYGEAVVSTGAEPELVDRTTPHAAFTPVESAIPAAAPSGADGRVLLFDATGDGALDLLTIDAGKIRLLRNERGHFVPTPAIPSGPDGGEGAIAGDYDNDTRPDLFVFGRHGSRLLRQRPDGTFEDSTVPAKLPNDLHCAAASWVDVDHDGDLDLVTAGPVRLFRNDGNGTFTEITREAGLGLAAGDPAAPAAIVPTDFDNRRDVDLAILSGGGPPHLFRNMRDGTFQDVASSVGLPQAHDLISVSAADVNKDGFIDFFFGRAQAPGLFALSDGRARFTVHDAPAATAGAQLAEFFDYDNDGLLDLFVATGQGTRLLRDLGANGWSDETAHAGLDRLGAARSLALGDLDRDGDTDIVAWAAGSARVWRNDGGNGHRALPVTLVARVSNRSALGTKVEVRAGSLRQTLETSAASPAVGPADLLFGLGDRPSADAVRALWPSGILQAELAPAASARLEELDRKPSSCPYLFAWNGSRFEFVTDFLGGGEMGDWVAPHRFDVPDPEEYVRITDRQLRQRDGRYEIRITNELEESMFLDRVRLLVVDHPADEEVYPNEGLKDPPRPSFRLYATRGAHVPARVVDDEGHDLRGLVTAIDRRWPDAFTRMPIQGFAAPHTITMDLGPDADRALLLLTGWTEYAFSSDAIAGSQAGLVLQPPVLQVRDRSGAWQTVDANIGFPVGRPQTIAVDMTGRWRGPSREVRVSTTMPIYWDRILVDTSGGTLPYALAAIDPSSATLGWRGFSAAVSPDGREPFGADYQRVSTAFPWKVIPGAYTREGEVRGLLAKSDDMFVVAEPGDEIALSFNADAAPALRPGWRRTFLLYADGFSKEMNIRSATPDTLGPLPFHGMSKYPYGPGEHYPDDPAHRAYLERENTRIVSRVIPSIDAAIAPAPRLKDRHQ